MAPLQKLPNNVGNLGKIIVATSFELLPKVQKSPILVTLVVGLSLCTNPPSLPPYILSDHLLWPIGRRIFTTPIPCTSDGYLLKSHHLAASLYIGTQHHFTMHHF